MIMLLCIVANMLQYDIKMNQLHSTLYKTLKSHTTTTFNLQLCSENAKICAYNGIKHTIEYILNGIKTMHLKEYLVTTKYKYFKLRSFQDTITIIVHMHQKDNKIIFAISNKRYES